MHADRLTKQKQNNKTSKILPIYMHTFMYLKTGGEKTAKENRNNVSIGKMLHKPNTHPFRRYLQIRSNYRNFFTKT